MHYQSRKSFGARLIDTPWGVAQDETAYGVGITLYVTARHGGFRVTEPVNQTIPDALRIPSGWYEEDCEAALVMVAFPDRFSAAQVTSAVCIVKNVFPDRYMAWTGTVLDPAESSTLRRRAFEAQTADRYVVTAAWGSWEDTVPAGMVGVLGMRRSTNETAGFLVPESEYQGAAEHPFIVDPVRHAVWVPPGAAAPNNRRQGAGARMTDSGRPQGPAAIAQASEPSPERIT